MSKFGLYFETAASVYVEVEADDIDEAVDAAYQKLPGGLCHQCAGDYDIGDLKWDDSSYEVDGKAVSNL